MNEDDPNRDPAFKVFGIIPNETEKARQRDPNADHSRDIGGMHQAFMPDELELLYDALRQVEDQDYAAKVDQDIIDEAVELGMDPAEIELNPRPTGEEAEKLRGRILADIERVKNRRRPRLMAPGLPENTQSDS